MKLSNAGPLIVTSVALGLASLAHGAVVENVTVDTSQAPDEYEASYTLNTGGNWYYVEAVLSDDGGADYPFGLGRSTAAGRSYEPGLPVKINGADQGSTINTYLQTSGAYSFRFHAGRPIRIEQARLRIVATPEAPIGLYWRNVTPSAPWCKRIDFQAAAHAGKFWVMGGYVNPPCPLDITNDVWSSSNGSNWTMVTAAAQWTQRREFGCTVHDNKLWVAGGSGVGMRTNDVWSSSNGSIWTRATAGAAWSARRKLGLVSFNSKLWVVGGATNVAGGYLNDVWYSNAGVNWYSATANAGWSARVHQAVVVFDNKLWVLGGYDGTRLNDVWYSSNGGLWTRATANAEWCPRQNHSVVALDGKLWLFGGYDGTYLNDVWCSDDGVTWSLVTEDAPWTGRHSSRAVTSAGRIWLIGGTGPGSYLTDVWRSPP